MSLAAELVENLGMSLSDVFRIIDTAPARYYVFDFPKRSGGKRTIAQPAKELKAIQRFLLLEKLSKFPIHSSATAYSKGDSIADNALVHVNSGPTLKLDFKGFFPSIKTADWARFARKKRVDDIDLADIPLYSKLMFWSAKKNDKVPRCLSIGAPTSPALSNILLFGLDEELSERAEKLGLKYSRYADDITVSAQEAAPILEFERFVRKVLTKRKSPNLTLNEQKRGFFTKGGRRTVTGLIITPDQSLSIGRDRKRKISAMLDHLRNGRLGPEDKALLKGLLGFSISVEVIFVERLRQKYGNTLIDEALRYRIPSRKTLQ